MCVPGGRVGEGWGKVGEAGVLMPDQLGVRGRYGRGGWRSRVPTGARLTAACMLKPYNGDKIDLEADE